MGGNQDKFDLLISDNCGGRDPTRSRRAAFECGRGANYGISFPLSDPTLCDFQPHCCGFEKRNYAHKT